ncbi:MAG TPA: dihydrodipicolinate synthase family protein [Candidatus Dormibacteraeota bacterium]|nr:dihydrodipicolinate synthase family protein [Candidatus Dormibacteraeota bacterium]
MFELQKLTGVLVALVTPMTHEGRVDEPAVERLVQHVVGGGVHGLLALGSTGETASLDERARRTMLEAVVKAAARRVPVICGVAQSHLAAAREELKAAASLGADAVLVAPPFYYPTDQAGVLAFYRELAAGATLPLMLYNIPQFTKVVAEPGTVATLAREGTIQGIKDSSRDFEYFEGVCIATRDMPAFRIFTGSDTMLLASLAMGGAGTICGAGNVVPAMVVRIFENYLRGDIEAARSAQDRLYEVVVAVRAGVFPLAIKSALHMMGVCEPWSAPPVRQLDERLAGPLREALAANGLLTPERSRH